ncbi:hypothetical protein AAFM71_08060 [Chromobacterium violaceum]
MFDSSDKGIMLKAIMVAAPILLCMGLLPVLSFRRPPTFSSREL